MRALVLVCAVLAGGVGWSAPATTRSFAQLVHDAERLYKDGKYRESAQLLEQANALQPHARLVYDIARAYDQAGDVDPALSYYQRYVNSASGTDPTLLKRSAMAIDRLHAVIAKRDAARATSTPTPPTGSANPAVAAHPVEDEAQASHRRAVTTSLVVGGAGVALLGAGVTFGLLSRSSKAQFTAATTLGDKQRLEAQTRQRALIADVGMGVGIAALVTSVLLYPRTHEAPAPRASLTLTPLGLCAEGSF